MEKFMFLTQLTGNILRKFWQGSLKVMGKRLSNLDLNKMLAKT